MLFHLSSILNAANYESLCDFSLIPNENRYITPEWFKRGGKIFCKTDYITNLFDIIKISKQTYTLITHHSDYPITREMFANKPSCIRKWYAINPEFEHPDLIPLPLGVKTHSGSYLERQYMTEWFAYNINRLRNKIKNKHVYCNWNITNTDRTKIGDTLRSNNINITQDHNQPFYSYIENMAEHLFVISPPGNGIDCHRTWEALYCGCIPIVIQHRIYKEWSGLPIIQVKSYNDVTNELLQQALNKKYDFSALTLDFWKQRINNNI